jgi:hypothetical protein
MTDMLYSNGFQTGAAGWLNGVVSNDAFGAVLGPYGGTGGAETVQSTFDIPEGTEVASFTFDMIAIDSWDNEELIVFVDGEPAASLSFQHSTDGVTGQWVSDNPNYTFRSRAPGRANMAATMRAGRTRWRACNLSRQPRRNGHPRLRLDPEPGDR